MTGMDERESRWWARAGRQLFRAMMLLIWLAGLVAIVWVLLGGDIQAP